MPTYRFKCLDCNKKFDWYNIAVENRNVYHPECPECKSLNTKHIVADRLHWNITETNDKMSTKPDSYWANAEWNRKKAAEKRDAEKKEKLHYDEEYRQKQALAVARQQMFEDEDAAEDAEDDE